MSIWGNSKEFNDRREGFSPWSRKAVQVPVRFYWIIMLLVLALDQISKWIVMQTMVLHQSIPLLGNILQLTYVRNTGAAFSFLARSEVFWRRPLLISVALIASIILTVMAFREQNRGIKLMLPLGLVSGGALGNMVDRLFYGGAVVDFIEVGYRNFHWPVFNLADSAVVIGVCWLMFFTFHKSSQGHIRK